MNRIIRGTAAKKKRKKIFKYTKGCFGSHSKLFTSAKQQYIKANSISFADRKKKKRNYRKIWINRINCYLKNHKIKYNIFVKNIKEKSLQLNRKTLSKICLIDKKAMEKIIEVKI